jgi:hypothetical protein
MDAVLCRRWLSIEQTPGSFQGVFRKIDGEQSSTVFCSPSSTFRTYLLAALSFLQATSISTTPLADRPVRGIIYPDERGVPTEDQ